jgi:hypothetical protein
MGVSAVVPSLELEHRDSSALLERGVAVSREWNLIVFSVANTARLGYAIALSGQIAEDIPVLERTRRAPMSR